MPDKHLSADLKIAAIIPARWDSSRFPGKPLAPIAGRPMIDHVVRRTAASKMLAEVIVATDDQRIADAAAAAGATVAMTGEAVSGADRIAQVAKQRDDIDIIVNVQGDEPMITTDVIDAVARPFHEWDGVQVTTACRGFTTDEDPLDPNRVKVVTDHAGNALYFSRSPIPYGRDSTAACQLHIGIYAYWRNILLRFNEWAPSPLEQAEQLEQLRFLENGVPIRVVPVEWVGFAVDSPEDLAAVEEHLSSGTL